MVYMQQKIWMGMLEVKEMYEPLKFAAQSLTFMKLVYKKKSAERMNKKKKKKRAALQCVSKPDSLLLRRVIHW